MSPRFLECLNFVLRHEGGYVDDPVDRGGETKYGISKRAYPRVDISNLTKEQAAEIYYRDYWLPISGDDLPAPVDLVVFDTAVNSGVAKAAAILQSIVGARSDGIIGPMTLAAVQSYGLPEDLAQRHCWERMKYLADIVKRAPSQSRFIAGWTNRVSELAERAS